MDLISRQAAIERMTYSKPVIGEDKSKERYRYMQWMADYNALKEVPSVQPEQHWIPVKYRKMDEEERQYWSEQLGYDVEYEDAIMFDCKMPDDGQEILVSYRKWISMDKCEIDCGCYGLEENGDWDGVTAWMSLPEPWRGEEHES